MNNSWRADRKLAAEISECVHESIQRARLILDPYPYFIASDLMPGDFYKTAQYFVSERTAYAFPLPNDNGELRIPATRSFKNSPELTEEAASFGPSFATLFALLLTRHPLSR